ncbi:MAG: VanZ family protein [Thiohalocapsa sp.]
MRIAECHANRLATRLTVFRAALALCVLTVAWLALAPLEEAAGFSWDKSNHLFAFFVMACLADAAYPDRASATPKWSLLLLYGLFIELVQRELPYRHFSWLDFVADGAGILLYLAGRRLLTRGMLALRRSG